MSNNPVISIDKELAGKATTDLSELPLPLNDDKLTHQILFPSIPKFIHDLQETTGLPYYALIPMTTLSIKLFITLPISLWNRKLLVKQNELRAFTKAISPVMKMKLSAHNNASKHNLKPEQVRMLSMKEQRKIQREVFRENGIQLWKNIIQPISQLPIWMMFTYGIRELPAYVSQQTATNNTDEIIKFGYSPLDDLFPVMDMQGLNITPILSSSLLGSLTLLNIQHYDKINQSRQWYDLGKEHNGKLLRNGIMTVSRFISLGLVFTSFQQPDLVVLYWIVSQLGQYGVNKVVNKYPFERKLI
ncbi:uncharacterized protein HGUI_03618 [Hanseniaspora guilliermondii]|uniref:Mitochondrial inner membrane protein COX18 n=1 Tax=Hanseniaspora guilliermondii TaxID=56406 RepID=A0A1L0CS61_9ASCO|nr:uncharacterized protein HGUI_03618 [Hanseniaspora guilliermondii]